MTSLFTDGKKEVKLLAKTTQLSYYSENLAPSDETLGGYNPMLAQIVAGLFSKDGCSGFVFSSQISRALTALWV